MVEMVKQKIHFYIKYAAHKKETKKHLPVEDIGLDLLSLQTEERPYVKTGEE